MSERFRAVFVFIRGKVPGSKLLCGDVAFDDVGVAEEVFTVMGLHKCRWIIR
jgi:hypothetical protein